MRARGAAMLVFASLCAGCSGNAITTTAPTTSTTVAVGPATSSQSSAEPTMASPIPTTGSDGTVATNVALFALVVGFALVIAARLRTSASGESSSALDLPRHLVEHLPNLTPGWHQPTATPQLITFGQDVERWRASRAK